MYCREPSAITRFFSEVPFLDFAPLRLCAFALISSLFQPASLAARLVFHVPAHNRIQHLRFADLLFGYGHDVFRQHGDVRELADFE